MIIETSDTILEQLRTIDGPKTIEDWGGEIDDVINQTGKLPALLLVYGGSRFAPKQSIGSNRAEHAAAWTVIVIDKNLRGKDAAAEGCYELIEAVRAKLIGFDTDNGWLWPVGEALIHSEKGKLAYALEYTNDAETEDQP